MESRSSLLLLLLLFLFTSLDTCAGSPAPSVSKTRHGSERPGQACSMGNGHIGRCTDIYQCLQKKSTILSNNILHLCNSDSSGKIQVCCKDYVQLAADLCSSWQHYSLNGRDKTATNGCVVEHQLIVGGTEAAPGEFKYIARVGAARGSNINYNCGGILVSPVFVLTAAHCVEQQQAQYYVLLGDHDSRDLDFNKLPSIKGSIPRVLYRAEEMIQTGENVVLTEQESKVRRKVIHPLYVQTPKYHDLALLELEAPIVLTPRIVPICLTTQPYIEPKNNDTLIAAGWGRLGHDIRVAPPALQKVSLPKLSNLKCNKEFKTDTQNLPLGITNDMICAGEEGKDTCRGDSGGPLIRVIKSGSLACEHELVGAVAFGPEDCRGIGVYTRIHQYLPWIMKHILAPGYSTS